MYRHRRSNLSIGLDSLHRERLVSFGFLRPFYLYSRKLRSTRKAKASRIPSHPIVVNSCQGTLLAWISKDVDRTTLPWKCNSGERKTRKRLRASDLIPRAIPSEPRERGRRLANVKVLKVSSRVLYEGESRSRDFCQGRRCYLRFDTLHRSC